MAGRPQTRARLAAEEAERAQRLLEQARNGQTALDRTSARLALREMAAPALPTPADADQAADMTREELSRRSPEIARRLCRCAMGDITLTFQEIQASKLILDKLVASAVQRVDIRATVEVRDKRQAIDAMVEALLRPGAVGKAANGQPVLNLPASVTESRLSRADGRGPPTTDATGMPVEGDGTAPP
jgi:hypothetical protein